MALSTPLVQPSELAEHQPHADLVIVDCRHQLTRPGAGLAAYHAGHIPGAAHVDLDRDLSRRPGPMDGRHPLPSPESFAATLGGLGISNRSFVVAYDDVGGAMAARLWWMLRWVGHDMVSVLDGGIQAWSAAGLPLESGGLAGRRKAEFRYGAAKADWIVATAAVQAALASGEAVLVDARAPERFEGRVEPIDPVAGHVPGAINLPFSRLLADDGRFAGASLIAARFTEVAGDRTGRDVITMCGSGVTACHLLLAMESAGLGLGRLYAGSWSEWIRDPARPIATSASD